MTGRVPSSILSLQISNYVAEIIYNTYVIAPDFLRLYANSRGGIPVNTPPHYYFYGDPCL